MTEPAPEHHPTFKRWRLLVSMLHMRPGLFVLSSVLALGSALFEGISAGALIPLLEGALQRDYGFLFELPGFKQVLPLLPESLTGSNSSLFGLLLGVCFLAVFLKLLLAYGSAVAFDKLLYDLMHQLRALVMRRYLRLGLRFFDDHNAGYLRSLLMGHTNSVIGALGALRMILIWGFSILAYAILMFVISWQLALVSAVLFPLLYVSLSFIVKQVKWESTSYARVARALSVHSFNLLVCMPLVRASNKEGVEAERFDTLSEEMADIDFKQARRLRLLPGIQELIVISVVLGLVVLVGMTLGGDASASLSGYLVFFYLLRRCASYFNELNRTRGSFARLVGPLEQLLEVLEDEGMPFIPSGAVKFEGLREAIRFERLSFEYVPGSPVLQDVSFTIEKGRTTAIVGQTGSGKTTVVNLLMRFYDVPPGTITIDGRDIRDLDPASLRDSIAYVSQDSLLMNDTIRANICYGLEGAVDDAALADAIEKARLADLVSQQQDGLNAMVGDRGIKLSGGEKQRISLARALLKNAELLILDEATSSLDTLTEQLVQEAIDACLAERTAIVIAHRLSTIRNADWIVLLEDGRLVEEGTLSELLAREGAFMGYWKAQSFDEAPSDTGQVP